jgi:hypothetical protein
VGEVMVNAAWRGEVRWIGPPLGRSQTAGDGRIWRWSDDEKVGSLVDPPGAGQPGLALLVDERPWLALGRHPVRHPRNHRDPSWHHQQILLPTDAGAWSPVAVFQDRFHSGVLLDGDGVVVAEVDRPGRLRSTVQLGDSLQIGGARYGVEPVLLGVAAGQRPRWWAATKVVGVRVTGPRAGTIRAEVVADRDRGFDGDVTSKMRAHWSVQPAFWEAATVLALLAAAIDRDHLVSND